LKKLGGERALYSDSATAAFEKKRNICVGYHQGSLSTVGWGLNLLKMTTHAPKESEKENS